jgi:hypothetical protein
MCETPHRESKVLPVQVRDNVKDFRKILDNGNEMCETPHRESEMLPVVAETTFGATQGKAYGNEANPKAFSIIGNGCPYQLRKTVRYV